MTESENPNLFKTRWSQRIRRIRKRWWVLLCLLVFIGPNFYYRATAPNRQLTVQSSEPIDLGRSADQIKFATWNIAHWRGTADSNWTEGGQAKAQRVSDIAKQIKLWDADVVLLNEVDFDATWSGGLDQAELIAKEAGYSHVLKQSNLDFGFLYGRWRFGNVLLSRFPIRNAEAIELSPVNNWEPWIVGCKGGFSCEIQLTRDKSVRFVGLHLESRGEDVRVRQVNDVCNALNRWAEGASLLVAGDLNTTPSDFPGSRTGRNGRNAFDQLTNTTRLIHSVGSVECMDQLTFPSTQPTTIIDWILYRASNPNDGQVKPITYSVIQSELSDHLPVVAQFELN